MMQWKRMPAHITGSVNEDLLRRIEYLLEENRVLRNQIQKRILLTDHERRTLAEKAVALGKLPQAATLSIWSMLEPSAPRRIPRTVCGRRWR